MWKTTIRRLIILIPQLIGVSLIIFILSEFMPGDALGGEWTLDYTIDPVRIQEIRDALGLDDPWPQRYGRWIANMLRGDFGQSITFRMPVTQMIGERIGNTMLLSILSVIIVYSFALPLGIIAGRYRGRLPEKIISFYNFLQMSFPTVVFAIVLLWAFAIIWPIFPLRGTVDVSIVAQGNPFAIFISRIHHAILPALAGSLLSGVGIIQFLSNEINDQKNMDYTNLARSKGVPMGHVYRKHIFRNALLPIASGFGFILTGLFGGAVIIENIFNFNGMGRMFVSSMGLNDWPVVNFLIVFYASLTIVGFLLSDIALTIFDPRIRIK